MRSKKVLIVEDEAYTLMTLKLSIKSLGYEILGAVSKGEAALELIKMECPSLIIMDVSLKGLLDGIETAKAIRRYCSEKIIFITGYDDEDTNRRIAEVENSIKLEKPISISLLENIICKCT